MLIKLYCGQGRRRQDLLILPLERKNGFIVVSIIMLLQGLLSIAPLIAFIRKTPSLFSSLRNGPRAATNPVSGAQMGPPGPTCLVA